MLWSLISSAWAWTAVDLQQQKLYPALDWASSGGGYDIGTGDFDGDGYADLAVSGGDAGELSNSGEVYVYYGASDGIKSWSYDRLFSSDQAEWDRFGGDIAAAGDIDGDGYDDLLVGAYSWSEADLYRSGAAYVYYGSPIGLLMESEQRLLSPSPAEEELFGAYLAGGGDLNGDGYDDAIVASYYDAGCYWAQGRAYVYYGSPDGLEEASVQTLIASDTGSCDYFATALAIAGDLDGDGYDDALIGAQHHDGYDGAAYLFYGSAAGLDPATEQKLTSSLGSSGYYFGLWVGAVGDVNGDGWADLGVSARSPATKKCKFATHGRVDIYFGEEGGPSLESDASLEPLDPCASDEYGYRVSAAGDLDGDGYGEIAVSAEEIYLYYGSSAGPDPASEQAIEAYDKPAGTDDDFGRSLALGGDLDGDGIQELLVGNWSSWNGDGSSGAVYALSPTRDGDSDGIDAGRDCDDADAKVGEAPLRYRDWDEDGYATTDGWAGLCEDLPVFSDATGGDCDDEDPAFNPGVEDVCGDYQDTDCDGLGDYDDDEDGDGISSYDEHLLDLDPCDPDSDDDGVMDTAEGGGAGWVSADPREELDVTAESLDTSPSEGSRRGCDAAGRSPEWTGLIALAAACAAASGRRSRRPA